jgi:hypothetical protein
MLAHNRQHVAQRIAAVWQLKLGDFGAHVTAQGGCERCSQHRGHIENANSLKRATGG